MVYTSENLSLAALELFVHVAPGSISGDLIALQASLPANTSCEIIEAATLPAHWRQYPAPFVLQDQGTAWLKSKSSCALKVPSAINPQERNLLLNPQHPEMRNLQMTCEQPFQFDPRMFGN